MTEAVDVLLNVGPITEEGFTALVPLVRDGGVVVSTTPMVPTPGDDERGVRAVTIFLHPDAAVLTELVGLVDSGDLKVEIAQRVPLPELIKVHEEAEAGRLRGKVVVVPFGED